MSFSNDVLLRDNDICFYFKYLEWDSDFFNKSSYILDINKSIFGISDKIKNEIKHFFDNSFVTIKLNTNTSFEILNFFQECGFKYIESEIVLEQQKNIENIENNKIQIIEINKNIDLPYVELGSCFTNTRFHNDINISNEKADKLWIEYIKNYKPYNNKNMFLAKYENDIAGVAMVNNIDNVAYLFYISVLDKYGSFGVGSVLISKISKIFSSSIIRTGTQVSNNKALDFYFKNYFLKVYQTNTVLHYWG